MDSFYRNCKSLFENVYTNNIFNLSNEKIVANILEEIDKCSDGKLQFCEKDNIQICTIISTIYCALGKLLSYEFDIFTTNEVQIEKKDKLLNYFLILLSDTSDNSKYLFTISHLCVIVTLYNKIKNDGNFESNELIKFAALSMLCKIFIYDWNNSTEQLLNYKSLIKIWTPSFPIPFTKTVWEEITRTFLLFNHSNITFCHSFESSKVNCNLLSLNESFNLIDNMFSFKICKNTINNSLNLETLNSINGIAICVRTEFDITEKELLIDNIEQFLSHIQINFKSVFFINNDSNEKIIMIEQENEHQDNSIEPIDLDLIVENKLVLIVNILTHMPWSGERIELTKNNLLDNFANQINFFVSKNKFSHTGFIEFFTQLKYLTMYCKTKFNNTHGKLRIPNIDKPSTEEMNIVEYCNFLYRTTSWEKMIQTFKKQKFMIQCPTKFKNSPYKDRIIKIKYLEHNKLWKSVWARQCRGVILFLNNENKIVPIKYQLQRGAELLMPMHKTNGVTQTNDIDCIENHINVFDKNQQMVMTKLSSGENIDGILSFKSDGSLFGLTCYFGACYTQLIEDFIQNYADDFCKTIYNLGKCIGITCVASSQNTFCVGIDMQSYYTTAILSEILNESDLIKISKTMSYIDALKIYGLEWFERLENIIMDSIRQKNNVVSITINFESICKNRLSLWENTPRNELAISHDYSTMKFLGVGVCNIDNVQFIPHFEFNESSKLNLNEPLYWKIDKSSQINEMLSDLEILCSQDLSTHAINFFNKHQPINYSNISEAIKNRICLQNYIDFEGFIFYTPTKKTHITGEYDYNKIKTITYYKCHKFSSDNIDFLMDISEKCGNIFPISKKVKMFFTDINLNLHSVLTNITNNILKNHDENIFYKFLSDKAKISYLTHNEETKVKFLINSLYFESYCFDIFCVYFPSVKNNDILCENKTTKNNISRSIKNIVSSLELWKFTNDEIKNIVENYIENKQNNIHLKELIFCCLDN